MSALRETEVAGEGGCHRRRRLGADAETIDSLAEEGETAGIHQSSR